MSKSSDIYGAYSLEKSANLQKLIKNNSKDFLLSKCPHTTIPTVAHLMLDNSEDALFCKNGVIRGVIHGNSDARLSEHDYPFIHELLLDMPDYSRSFECTIYFVNHNRVISVDWDSRGLRPIYDPVWHIRTTLAANGMYTIRVFDSKKFLARILKTGLNNIGPSNEKEVFQKLFFKELWISITKSIKNSNRSLLDLSKTCNCISEDARSFMNSYLSEFGVEIVGFQTHALSMPLDDKGSITLLKRSKETTAIQSFNNVYEYRIGSMICNGGSSNVYHASRNGCDFAIKFPLTVSANCSDTICLRKDHTESFVKGIELQYDIAKSVPDSAVYIYDYSSKPIPWCILELADYNLRYALDSNLVNVSDMVEILKSLQELHDRDFIHTDIKPENILKVNGVWKFTDFTPPLDNTLENNELLRCSPLYLAPEQLDQEHYGVVDSKTDIWQMGIILYELLAGKSPYLSSQIGEILSTVMMDKFDFSKITDTYRPILKDALSTLKVNRLNSAKEFAVRLEEAVNHN